MKTNYQPKTEACFSVYFGDTSMVVGMAQEMPNVDRRPCDKCQAKGRP